MNYIQNSRFKINGTEYIVTGVWWQAGVKAEYEFKTLDWDKPVSHYKMSACDFEKKVTIENYVGL